MPAVRTLLGLAFVGFGIFVALATWLQQLLEPAHVSEALAGALLVGMIVGASLGCAVLPPIVSRRGGERAIHADRRRARGLWRCALLAASSSMAPSWSPLIVHGGRAAAGSAGDPDPTPSSLAGAAAGTAGAIVWMAGNLGGLVVALIVQVLVHDPVPAFLVMAAVALTALPLAGRLRPAGAQPSAAMPVV